MLTVTQTATSSDVRQAVVRYLLDRVDNPSISIADAVDAIREMFPLCELTDWQLGDHIARAAIDAGFVVEFDVGLSE
ncbi:hypothetical protein LB572_12335 [Mesorhizobium sp. BH1-1-5]|uniref:hypothetical protein n=1 Tax=unclassified Mesorhizobium TaxID=325217 RepID=UPI001128F673|nr:MULTISPECIES: hypothetical protein [unclassified Mesorhizobium]MBZ9987879.1 hypothetical protein [Mesorhizobium sp. BH1-1-5]TPJ69683.1 hypothetical protein FJ471_09810 [Mesorhizobium sp. B2-7-1]